MAKTIGNALLTAYPDVTFDGVTYDGHWSWIYVARNDPRTPKGNTSGSGWPSRA